MPLYVADYLADTLDLRADESCCYLLLLMISWRRGGALPNDMNFIRRSLSTCVIDMHGNRFNRIVPKILDRYFTIDQNGDFINKRLGKELEKARTLSGKQKENARKRWAKSNNSNDLADAMAMPVRASLQSQPQSQYIRECVQEHTLRGQARAPDLRQAIVQAFAVAGSPSIPDTSRAAVWLSRGWKPEVCLAVISECLVKKPSISSLSYFEKPIADAHAAPLAQARAPPKPRTGLAAMNDRLKMELENEQNRCDQGGNGDIQLLPKSF